MLVPMATGASPRAHLRGFVCQKAVDPPMRDVSVQAVMRHIPGTVAMAIRFQLYEKPSASGSYSPLQVGDLGTWISPSNPTLGQRSGDVWALSHPVANLPAPASYQFIVTFRWTGAHGKVLATDVRTSPRCSEPELRPDLAVTQIDIAPDPNHPKLDQYVVTVANLGLTAVGPVAVQFTSPGGAAAPKAHTVERLGPHATHQETFEAPICTAATAPTVTVDPQHTVINDLNYDNNVLTVPSSCPPQTTAT